MANYWHFQLFTKDNAGNIIPRNKSNARSKHLAKYVLENIMLKAMCQTTDVKPFRRDDFDKVLEASPTV
ncbi:MAG: hypothetical protein LBT01_02690, partial [Spirochaetaceae bacterium]|jgi:hypothetical protein|nr:hypothetical protein [Spirochaetaceae bacterium]